MVGAIRARVSWMLLGNLGCLWLIRCGFVFHISAFSLALVDWFLGCLFWFFGLRFLSGRFVLVGWAVQEVGIGFSAAAFGIA